MLAFDATPLRTKLFLSLASFTIRDLNDAFHDSAIRKYARVQAAIAAVGVSELLDQTLLAVQFIDPCLVGSLVDERGQVYFLIVD